MVDGPFARVNFRLPREDHERLSRLRWGLRSYVLRAAVGCINELWDREGDNAMNGLIDGRYILIRRHGNEPPKSSGTRVPPARRTTPTSAG